MATKVILRFNGLTTAAPPQSSIGYVGAQHAFGFSETFWKTAGTPAAIKVFTNNILAAARAQILPSNVKIVDALMYTAGGGRGTIIPIGRSGVQPASDQVNVAALVATRHTTAPAQRRWWVHCLPDNFVIEGELVLSNANAAWFRSYLDAMAATQWLGVVKNDLQSVITITSNGLVTLPGVSPFSVGQLLRVTRTLTADKRRKGAQKFVTAIGPGTNQFTLGDWTLGACTGGTIFRPTYDFYNVGDGDGPFVERAGTKRCGRPFGLYRGRQPVRR